MPNPIPVHHLADQYAKAKEPLPLITALNYQLLGRLITHPSCQELKLQHFSKCFHEYV